MRDDKRIIELISQKASVLHKSSDLDPLIDYIGDSKFVLLGEASHGTHEYYTWRMKISQRLIEEKGFSFIAVEGDWPDCYRVNRYVKGYKNSGKDALEVLHEFDRWPTWMWANWEMVAFIDWLKKYNDKHSLQNKIGFYGMDVYSLWESMEAITKYLEKEDPIALQTAKKAMHCFEPYGDKEGQAYARASAFVPELCEKEVINLLSEIRAKSYRYNSDYENVFSTQQNALVVVNAEKYYRSMLKGSAKSWNIRDKHMVATLDHLLKFHKKNAKVIIWEHNTHIGDARATEMARQNMINVGQMVSEKYDNDGVVLVGFGSYEGSVIAGREWGDEMRKLPVPPAIDDSWEYISKEAFHGKDFLLLLESFQNEMAFSKPIKHRAIGVVYNPELEKFGNYVPSIISKRYHAFIFIHTSKALHPLHIKPDDNQIPETFPFGV